MDKYAVLSVTVFLSEIANPKQINCFLELEIESWSQDFFSKGFSVTHCLLLQGTIGGQSSIFTMQFIVFFLLLIWVLNHKNAETPQYWPALYGQLTRPAVFLHTGPFYLTWINLNPTMDK